jgi:hypothetical protein
MPLDLDPHIDRSICAEITLAGGKLLVAPLVLRHMLAITPLLAHAHAAIARPIAELTEENFRPVVEIVWRGLWRTYPSLTMDELADMPATVGEFIKAIPVILKQGGFWPQEEHTDPGEPPATS